MPNSTQNTSHAWGMHHLLSCASSTINFRCVIKPNIHPYHTLAWMGPSVMQMYTSIFWLLPVWLQLINGVYSKFLLISHGFLFSISRLSRFGLYFIPAVGSSLNHGYFGLRYCVTWRREVAGSQSGRSVLPPLVSAPLLLFLPKFVPSR